MKAQADFAAALLRTRSQGAQAMKQLAENHLPLVAAMVKRFPPCGREREELYQQGCVGLMKALARFNPDLGVAFSTYAAPLILGEMRMLCRQDAPVHVPRLDREKRGRIRRAEQTLRTQLGREPTVDELARVLRLDPAELVLQMEDIRVCSIDAPNEDGSTLAERLIDQDDWMDRLMLRDLLARLPAEDRRLLLLRYRVGLTQAEVARRMGMTQMQVSRRERLLQKKLRRQWQAD